MNELFIPYLIPVKFVKMNPVQIPQYLSKFMDDYIFCQTIPNYNQQADYPQQWATVDSVRLQVVSNYGPLRLSLHTMNGDEVYSQDFETRQQDFFRPGYYIRQSETALSAFAPGMYYWQINVGDVDPWISEPQEFLEPEQLVNTKYIEYSNREMKGGVRFGSPYSPSIRVPAAVELTNLASRSTTYQDQPANEVMIKSTSYRVWKFTLGDAKGVPPWLLDKVGRILECSEVRIDGRYFTKPAESEWERNITDLVSLAGWTVELRERYNMDGMFYQDDVLKSGRLVMAAVIDTKGFGVSDNGGDFLEILDIN